MRESPEAEISIPYRHSGLVLPLVVLAGGALFAVAAVIGRADPLARFMFGALAVLAFLLGGYALVWMIRGARSHPGPLVIGREGLYLNLQGELYVPWGDVVACRIDRDGSLFLDLTSPISHFALSGVLRKHARSQTLVISSRFFDLSRQRLGDLISSHIAG